MARTVQQLANELAKFISRDFRATADLQIGLAAPLTLTEQLAEDCVAAATVSGAEGIWLTLLAGGYGIQRATAEPDASLRTRLRNVDNVVTRGAILLAVENLAGAAEMIEWFEQPFLDCEEDGFWLDSCYPSGGPNTFLLFVPLVGPAVSGDSFLDIEDEGFWLDSDAFLGSDEEDPLYDTIVAEVERIRAAGIRWALVIGDVPVPNA